MSCNQFRFELQTMHIYSNLIRNERDEWGRKKKITKNRAKKYLEMIIREIVCILLNFKLPVISQTAPKQQYQQRKQQKIPRYSCNAWF